MKQKIISNNFKGNLLEDINDIVEFKLDENIIKNNDSNQDLYNLLLDKVIKSNKKTFNTFKSTKEISNKYSFNKKNYSE